MDEPIEVKSAVILGKDNEGVYLSKGFELAKGIFIHKLRAILESIDVESNKIYKEAMKPDNANLSMDTGIFVGTHTVIEQIKEWMSSYETKDSSGKTEKN